MSDIGDLRKELVLTRIGAYGFSATTMLALFHFNRLFVLISAFAVFLTMFFFKCLWGVGDTNLTLSQSIGATFTLGIVFALLVLWGGIR
jgi:hypothetical protein